MKQITKFPLPEVPTSEVQYFKLFIQKAKPLKRAMDILKNAMNSYLQERQPQVVISHCIHAAALAGRGATAAPKLAAAAKALRSIHPENR